MKNRVPIEKFFELTDEQIFGLFKTMSFISLNLKTPEDIGKARRVFVNMGVTHTAIDALHHGLNMTTILDILTKNHTVKAMEQQCIIHNEPDYGFKWYIELFHDIDVPLVTAED